MRLRTVLSEYQLDKRELAKSLIVASVALLFFSSFAILSLRSNNEELKEVQQNLDSISNEINSQEFNSSLQALEDIKTTPIGNQFVEVTETMRETKNKLNGVSEVSSNLKSTYKTFQWVFLASILGLAAGVTIIFI